MIECVCSVTITYMSILVFNDVPTSNLPVTELVPDYNLDWQVWGTSYENWEKEKLHFV